MWPLLQAIKTALETITEIDTVAIGAETGLAHAACAVRTQNVVVLGGGHFGRFMPYSNLTSAVILPLSCYGCNWWCKYKKSYCVDEIDTRVIEEAIRHTISKKNSKPILFIQDKSLYRKRFFGPRWRLGSNLLNLNKVETILVR